MAVRVVDVFHVIKIDHGHVHACARTGEFGETMIEIVKETTVVQRCQRVGDNERIQVVDEVDDLAPIGAFHKQAVGHVVHRLENARLAIHVHGTRLHPERAVVAELHLECALLQLHGFKRRAVGATLGTPPNRIAFEAGAIERAVLNRGPIQNLAGNWIDDAHDVVFRL